MKSRTQTRAKKSPRVLKGCKPDEKAPNPGKFGRRRAAVLIAVNALILAHIVQWKLTGKTLMPLEFSEATLAADNGLITAGLILMVVSVLSVVAFGRLFCGWACHILALQDFCAWMLGKMGIKPKPIRSRLLFLLPALLFGYMFLWTPFRRLIVAWIPEAAAWLGSPGEFALRMPAEAGMSSFITADFWRNMPGPGIAILTFAACGFAAVYLLGSRGFCAYACPYGALFSWADKLAPGKLMLSGDCTACGKCTAACKSGVNVMHEVRTFGKVVDTNCFKDMDCVASCPEQALSFGFGKPTAFSGEKSRTKPHTFSTAEEWSMLAVFAATLFLLVGLPEGMAPWAGRLYGVFPLLLSATLAVFTAVSAVYGFRLLRRPEVEFQRWTLKKGSLKKAGMVFSLLTAGWTAFLFHSAWVQYHMFQAGRVVLGERGRDPALRAEGPDAAAQWRDASLEADGHLRAAGRLGVFHRDPRIPRQRAFLALNRGDWDLSEAQLREAVALQPKHPDSRFHLGWILAGRGKTSEALEQLGQAESLEQEGGRFQDAVWKGGLQLLHRGLSAQAVDLFSAGMAAIPGDSLLHRRVMALLEKSAEPSVRISFLEDVLRRNPRHSQARKTLDRIRAQSGGAEKPPENP
jgi:polyferredoxin